MFFQKNKTKMDIIDQVIDVAHISKIDQKNMKHVLARVFSSSDGKKALAYLQYLTLYRNLGAEASHESLRFHEGQRALLSTILRMIEQGRES